MPSIRRVVLCLVLCAVVASSSLLAGCSGDEDTQPPVATPHVQFNRQEAALGSPVEVAYRFTVAEGAAFDQDYYVMVHFLDSDEELMWTDDHLPPVPTRQWKPGQVVEYTRTMFVPIYPYIGEASVQVGLYSPAESRRLPLSGNDAGQRTYRVGTLRLLPQTDNIFLIYKDGWHPTEVAQDNSMIEWQWTKKTATISFRNPKRDCLFYLHLDNPGSAFTEPQSVQILLNGQPVDRFTLKPGGEHIQRTWLLAAQFGTEAMAELRLDVDKTYVPALLPSAQSGDPRELGVRVFHAFVEPLS